MVGGRGEKHSQKREQDQSIVFSDSALNQLREFDRHNQNDHRGEKKKPFEEERQLVQRIHLSESIFRLRHRPKRNEAIEQYKHDPKSSQVAQFPPCDRRKPQVNEQNSQGERSDQQFMTD